MNKQELPQFPTLLDDVRSALKQWHDASAPSAFGYLYIFRQIARERQLRSLHDERGAINQLLRSAIERLGQRYGTDAELLQYRFLDAWPIQRLANHYNMADSTIYSMQTKAIERLTDVVYQMEFDASAAHKERLVARLEPATYVNLVGVDNFVAQLQKVLTNNQSPWLISLEGIGGIGKTALADHTVRLLIHQGAVDEVGWVTARQVRSNLGGVISELAEPTLSSYRLVERLVAQLMPELAITQLATGELVQALQSRMKTIPHLIVIDNLETLVDIENLLPILYSLINPSKIILTSRESLRKEANIFHFQLTELSQSDALALIRQEAIQSNLPLLAECTDEELAPLIAAVGGNPMALRLVAGQTHIHTLKSIIEDLLAARSEPIENLYTFIYRRAWDALDQLTQQVFLVMPLTKPSGETLEFLTKICQLEIDKVLMALNKLVSLNLVDVWGGLHERRYSINSLTRTFLQEQVMKWSKEDHVPGSYIEHHRENIIRSAQLVLSRLNLEDFSDELQHQTMQVLDDLLHLSDAWDEVRDLFTALLPKMAIENYESRWIALFEKGYEKSQIAHEFDIQAQLSFQLGLLCQQNFQFCKATDWYARSTNYFAAIGDQHGQAWSVYWEALLRYVYWEQSKAIYLADQILESFGHNDLVCSEANLLLGWISTDQNDTEKALGYFHDSLLLRSKQDQSEDLKQLVNNAPDRCDQAIAYHNHLFILYETHYDAIRRSITQLHLGKLYLSQNMSFEALEKYISAEQFFRQIGNKLHMAIALNGQAAAYQQLQHWEQAETCYHASKSLWEQVGNSNGLLSIRDALSQFYLERDQYSKAVSVFKDAQQHLEQWGYTQDIDTPPRDHPLCVNAERFFRNARLELVLIHPLLIYRCKQPIQHLRQIAIRPVYIQFLPDKTLDYEQVLLVFKQVKAIDSLADLVLVVTDRRPADDGWAHIGTLRMNGFTIVPLETAIINGAIANGNELSQLKLELESRLGNGYDPYDIRSPVSSIFSFFGREAQIEKLLWELDQGQPIGIFGLRKLGKSSLLRVLRNRVRFPVALIDLGTIGVEEELFELYDRIVEEWKKQVWVQYELEWNAPNINSNAPKADFIKATNSLLDFMRQQTEDEARIGIFLDEIESISPESPDNNFIPASIHEDFKLMRYVEFFRTLRGIINQNNSLSLVVAGRDPTLNRLNYLRGSEQNPLFSFFSIVNLPPLQREHCIQMIANLGQQVELTFDDGSLDLIYTLSGGHPFLARQLCSAIYSLRSQGASQVDRNEVTTAAKRYIYSDNTVEHIDSGIWQDAGNPALWGKLGAQVNQQLLLDLAISENPIPEHALIQGEESDARISALHNLEYYHFVEQQKGDHYTMRFGLLKYWLRQRKLSLGNSL